MFRTNVSLFQSSDQGQDLAEYCLLMALVALIALGLLSYSSGGLLNIWTSANQTLASSGSATSGQPASGSNTPSSSPQGGSGADRH